MKIVKNKGFFIGLFALVVVIASIISITLFNNNKTPQITVSGYLGGEKIGLFENPEFKDYVKDEYGLTMDYTKNGSIDMVSGDAPKGQDYLFPSSQTALQIYQANGNKAKSSSIVFNTPIVIYSWKPVVEKLQEAGYVKETNGVYTVDMVQLSQAMKDNKQWKELGVDNLYGSVNVSTTDPNASNSGNMFLGLMANSLNNGQPLTQENLPTVEQDLKTIYQRSGYMNTSSSDMFDQYLSQGMGAFPMVAGYENQLLEFSKSNPDVYKQVKDDVVMLYPTPTVWSSHVFIAQDDNAVIAEKALKDPKVQDIAWKEHGFRTAVAGTVNTKDFSVPGLAENVDNVMPLPSYEIMQKLMESVKQ